MQRLLTRFTLSFLVAAFLLIGNWSSIYEYFTLPYIAGWDGIAHQIIGEYYSGHIFPSVWGWIPYWYAGMPFPQFYPPLFYFLLGVIDHIFFFADYLLLFKIFVVCLLVAVPLLSMHLAWKWTGRRDIGFFAGCLGVLFMSVDIGQHYYGVSVTSTIAIGMVTQLLGYVAFLTWLKYILKIGEGRLNYLSAGMALAAVMLSNAHIVLFAALCVLTIGIIEIVIRVQHKEKGIREYIGKYIGHLFIAGGIVSVWYIPLLAHYSYFAGISLPETYEAKLYFEEFWYVHIIIFIAAVFAWRRRDRIFMHLSAILILTDLVIIAFSWTDNLNLFLPVHVTRFIAPHLYLSIFSIIYLLALLIENNKRVKRLCAGSGMLVLAIAVLSYHTTLFSPSITGVYRQFESDRVEDIANFLSKRKTLSVVEVDLLREEPRSFVVDGWIGKKEGMTIFSNLRESSISSIFLGPARNIISSDWELWGTVSYIAQDRLFINPNLRTALDRLRYLGVNNIVSLSQEMRKWLAQSLRLQSEFAITNAEIFSFKEPVLQAEILKYEPVLLFVPTSFREREMHDADYVRFQEELFNQNTFDIIGVRAENDYLDDAPDLSKFKFAIVSEYKYKDEDRAYEALITYVENGGRLLLLDSKDPLFLRLKDVRKVYQSITVFKKHATPAGTYPFKDAISFLKQHKTPTEGAGSVELVESENKKEIVFGRSLSREYPVLIKRSYFPAWKREDGGQVYLASPTYTFTFASDSFVIDFKKTWTVYAGQSLFFITILVTVFILLSKRRGK
jgi:hypothetical protein